MIKHKRATVFDPSYTTRVNCRCLTCGVRRKSELLFQPGCRGVRETACAPVHCPNGHGIMVREDGKIQTYGEYGPVVSKKGPRIAPLKGRRKAKRVPPPWVR